MRLQCSFDSALLIILCNAWVFGRRYHLRDQEAENMCLHSIRPSCCMGSAICVYGWAFGRFIIADLVHAFVPPFLQNPTIYFISPRTQVLYLRDGVDTWRIVECIGQCRLTLYSRFRTICTVSAKLCWLQLSLCTSLGQLNWCSRAFELDLSSTFGHILS